MGYYSWLHDFLFLILSAPRSTWPDASKSPMKKSRKYGSIKPNDQLITMALAGILAYGYDSLQSWEQRFMRIMDDYEGGLISSYPELYAQLELLCPRRSTWDRKNYYWWKTKLCHKVIVLNKKG